MEFAWFNRVSVMSVTLKWWPSSFSRWDWKFSKLRFRLLMLLWMIENPSVSEWTSWRWRSFSVAWRRKPSALSASTRSTNPRVCRAFTASASAASTNTPPPSEEKEIRRSVVQNVRPSSTFPTEKGSTISRLRSTWTVSSISWLYRTKQQDRKNAAAATKMRPPLPSALIAKISCVQLVLPPTIDWKSPEATVRHQRTI